MSVSAVKVAVYPHQDLERFMRCCLLAVALYMIMLSFAYANPVCTPMGEVLCKIVGWMWGNLGRGLSTLAVAILGVGACMGKISWGMAMTVGIGISVLYGAGEIVILLGISATTCT